MDTYHITHSVVTEHTVQRTSQMYIMLQCIYMPIAYVLCVSDIRFNTVEYKVLTGENLTYTYESHALINYFIIEN